MNSLVHPVPDEQREEPGHLLIRQLAVEHLLSFPRPNGGRLSAEQLEPPELPVHLLVGLFHPFPPFGKDLEAFQGVWVNFFPSLIGDCHPEGVEEDWRRGINRFSLRFLCWCGRRGMIKGRSFSPLPLRHKIWVLVTVVRYKDFLCILRGSVCQKERLIRKFGQNWAGNS